MSPESFKEMVDAVGEQNANLAMAFLLIVRAMRQQPAFDDAKFKQSISWLLEKKGMSDLIVTILQSAME